MNREYAFDDIGRLPMPGDNVAIATRRLETGSRISHRETTFTLDHTVMEGHRFAIEEIAAGEDLLSWNLSFGRALVPLQPGAYLCNEGILEALRGRDLDFPLPDRPNFADRLERYELDEAAFTPGSPVELYSETGSFPGYDRGEKRGAGTRNFIVVLGTSSRTASFARQLATRMHGEATGVEGIDGVVAVDHTEGGTRTTPNNRELVLRTLAGFVVHPNVGALLAVDYGVEAVDNRQLREYIAQSGYPLDELPHRFMTLSGQFEHHLEEGEGQIRQWLAQLRGTPRARLPLSRLKIALQCGGSDAFSGVSGNPLAAWVAREVIRHGGAANLAETDELIGAEPYVLQNVRDVETARRFLAMVERFKERVAWHGESAEGNPSGGNKYRGLYNIALKSIGAARKRNPDVRLERCIEYAEPMIEPGFHFMDSPGNDLESIAGQVASGCNLIFFVTGNGSVTNFPFVPTVKIVTTTPRYRLLADDMDVNAGAYQDGRSMDDLGAGMFDLTLRVAGGERTCGEKAGHSQVQLWRDWPQKDYSNLEELRNRPAPQGKPLILDAESPSQHRFTALRSDRGYATDRVGLILPTSLCSAQVARLAAERLDRLEIGKESGLSRFTALVHTEGCGGTGDEIYTRTMLGYLTHPLVDSALLLEHGCEKTHNDYMRGRLKEMGIDLDRFGWASIQMDGGIEKSLQRVEDWFRQRLEGRERPAAETVDLGHLRLGLLSRGPLSAAAIDHFAHIVRQIVGAGGTAVIPAGDPLLNGPLAASSQNSSDAALPYGQAAAEPGFYLMETPTSHWVETLTGLGATGVELILAHVGEHPLQGHPLVPLVQVTTDAELASRYGDDLDLAPTATEDLSDQLLTLLCSVASREQIPRAVAQRNLDFQMTRGLLGVSM